MENQNDKQTVESKPAQQQETTPAAQPAVVSNHPPELVEFIEYMKTNGLRLLINIAAAAALILGYMAYTTYSKTNQNASMEQLSKAKSIQDVESIVGKYPKSAAAPLALLQIAKMTYQSGNYDMALSKFTEFKDKYPKHEFVDVAENGRIHCIEARGQIQEALDAFSLFADSKPGHYLRPEALFGKARCMEQLGKFDDARTVYEEIIAADPKGGWAPRAEEALDLAKMKTKRPVKPVSLPLPILNTAPQQEQKSGK